MSRYLLLPFFLIVGLGSLSVSAQSCGGDNLGFESGDFTNWNATRYDGAEGSCDSESLPPTCPYLPCETCEQAPCKDPNDPNQCPIQDEVGFANFLGQLDEPMEACRGNSNDPPAPPQGEPRFTIMSQNGFDANTDFQLQTRSTHPLAGNFSARLGNQAAGYTAECIWNRFEVTEENSIFMYSYAVVLQDPIRDENQHHLYDSPRFLATLTDDEGVPVGCGGQFNSSSLDARDESKGFIKARNPACNRDYPPGHPKEVNNSEIYYRDWITHGINLSDHIGEFVTMKFCTADCGRGGHYAYAYVDIYCIPPQKGYFICTHGEPVTLNGPEGFGQYRWFEGGDTSGTFVGEGRDFVVNNPVDGATYTVSFTPMFGDECNRVQVTDTIHVFEAYVDSFDTLYCNIELPDRLEFNAHSNAPNTIYTWRSIPAGYTGSDSTLVLTGNQVPQENTTFIVNMRWGENSCSIEDTVYVRVEECGIGLDVPSFEYCLNATDTPECFLVEATVAEGKPPLEFAWTGLPFDPGDTDKVMVCTDVPVNYTVSVIDADSMTASASGQITVFYPPTVTIEPDSFCVGFGTGELTANVTGGNEPYTFQWSDGQNTQTAINLDEGTYTVTVTDAKGCWDTASSFITTYSYEGGRWSYVDCPGAIIQLETTPGNPTSGVLQQGCPTRMHHVHWRLSTNLLHTW